MAPYSETMARAQTTFWMLVPMTNAPPKMRATTGFDDEERGLVTCSWLWWPSRIGISMTVSSVSKVGQVS